MNRQRLDSPLVYVGAHNVRLVMLKRPLRKLNPAAAFLHITSLCEPVLFQSPISLPTITSKIIIATPISMLILFSSIIVSQLLNDNSRDILIQLAL